MVTYKKFGRKYTIPQDQVTDNLPKSMKKRIANTGTYYKRIKQLNNAPPMPVQPSPSYIYGTTGVTSKEQKQKYQEIILKNAGLSNNTTSAKPIETKTTASPV